MRLAACVSATVSWPKIATHQLVVTNTTLVGVFAGGYSRKPLPAQPDLLGDAERGVREGQLDAAGFRAVADAFVREILAEMAVVGVAIVGEGGIRARNRILPWIEGLDGLSDGGDATLPDGEPASRPIVRGPVRWTRPVAVRDWQFADAESDLPVKQTMVGPYTIAAIAEGEPGSRRAKLALQLGEALNLEIRALVAAGCPIVEIDEPMALQIGDDSGEWGLLPMRQRALARPLPTVEIVDLREAYKKGAPPVGIVSNPRLNSCPQLIDPNTGAGAPASGPQR